jgi:hypothetical protein
MKFYVKKYAKTFLDEKGGVCGKYVEGKEVHTWF